MVKDILFSKLLKPALFTLSPERAHALSLKALSSGLMPACPPPNDARLTVSVAGLDFPNPLGIAAGYDKNGEVPTALLKLGFGFTEIGTVTPRPQQGNPRPRIFRLPNEGAIINRLGFNNEGHGQVLARLRNNPVDGILGINIGANKNTADFIEDYVKGIAAFAEFATYFTINISSPNTPGLRDLQAGEVLQKLLEQVLAARDRARKRVPVFLKIAPDLGENQLDEIAAAVNASALDGIIISNTTLDRHMVANNPVSNEAGGLSGRPLFDKSTIILARMRQRLGPQFPIIGVGGIDSVETAIAKLEAGASLLQLYTGMIYHGPGLPAHIVGGLGQYLENNNIGTIQELTGCKTGEWAAKEIIQEDQ